VYIRVLGFALITGGILWQRKRRSEQRQRHSSQSRYFASFHRRICNITIFCWQRHSCVAKPRVALPRNFVFCDSDLWLTQTDKLHISKLWTLSVKFESLQGGMGAVVASVYKRIMRLISLVPLHRCSSDSTKKLQMNFYSVKFSGILRGILLIL